MNNVLLKRIETLENELQDLKDKLTDVTIALVTLINRVDPEGCKDIEV